ncbi:unnamed protein product [Clonostachys rhizophaga]|uniref:Peptidase S33 tripeptidyl aminopeptidase-like C-terminal domain-containing protein n=1 Tax=Clonostachys rhizophaga TaxID=160324 RepID=A0A9N9VP53_9HYPO|nr:unnamed protein product [Clonostachys rhizophaga]
MSKQGYLSLPPRDSPAPNPPRNIQRRRISFRFLSVLMSICIVVSLSQNHRFMGNNALHFDEPTGGEASSDFSWESITPQESLDFVPCFSSFQCARLSVPLNWNATTEERENGPRAALAVIKLPAKVPVTDPRYGGPILLNPGGPGESGVFQTLGDGKSLQSILDNSLEPGSPESGSSGGKYFDILSFDPRGVNNTTPSLKCFIDAFNQQAWLLGLPDYGLLWHSETTIGMEWAKAEALGASCSYGEGDHGILRYLNTAQTVEDMLQIVEQHGKWRELEVTRLLSAAKLVDQETTRETIERTAYRPGRELAQYWGMSYGTIIGSTFAAMHPDRVGRLVIDGVVDPADHYAGAWLTQLQDSDMIISKHCEYCFQAGPEECPLYTGTSPADIEARFTSILATLEQFPIAIPVASSLDGVSSGPAIVTYGDLHLNLLSGMYFPFAMAEKLFEILLAVESRNTSSPALVEIVSQKQAILNPFATGPAPYVSGFGPFQAISCMDSGGPTNLTREEFHEFVAILHSQGRWISRSWARNKLACLGYTTQPAWRPSLDFRTQEWANTSHPLLIIGNTHDTVTPIRNARRVSTLFPGSVVLQQDSQGHCSHSIPSLCTAQVVREYFQAGELPHEGAVCEPAVRPFIGCTKGNAVGRGECTFSSPEETRLWETMVDLADPFGLRS